MGLCLLQSAFRDEHIYWVADRAQGYPTLSPEKKPYIRWLRIDFKYLPSAVCSNYQCLLEDRHNTYDQATWRVIRYYQP